MSVSSIENGQSPSLAPMPFAWGGPVAEAEFRSQVEDFRVDELLGFEPDGEGGHCLLRVEKRDSNTEWVARQLARAAGVRLGDLGYSGLKDRRAVATQWFSLPPGARQGEELVANLPTGVRILEQHAHRRKLRRGTHTGNRFLIRLRAFRGSREELEQRLAMMARHGFPNYFGPQRFGIEGRNLTAGLEMLLGGMRVRERHLRSLYLSAVRSHLFNQVLGWRVAANNWLSALPGDWLNLNGSASRFLVEGEDEALRRRLDLADVHVTGPLWGRWIDADRRALERESECLSKARALTDALTAAGLTAERRPLRALPESSELEFDGDSVCLGFTLGRGVFATSLLRELIGDQALRRNAW